MIIRVPCGTIVRDLETGNAIADLSKEGDRTLVAVGGRGGRGNARFTSSVRQAPQFCEPGEPGVNRQLELELKLLADIGIIGLPNAGKSTLISVLSAAKPKIADYPFTTLVPNLGVIRKPNGDGVVMADIPGLISGAHTGTGLGHEFLRHIERCRLLLHLVDIATDEEPEENFDLINEELKKYSEKLAGKPQILVLTKTDAVPDEMIEHYREVFSKKPGIDVIYAISAVARQGLDELKHAMLDRLDEIPVEESPVEIVPDQKAFDHDDSAFTVYQQGRQFFVEGGKVERLMSVVDPKNRAALFRTLNILKSMGVYKALAQAGAREGDVVTIAGMDFDYIPDDDE